MKPLLSKAGIEDLRSLKNYRTLYAFDFDGTLAKLTPHPDQAKVTGATRKFLQELSHSRDTAVISGRGLSDLTSRLSFKPKYVIGNHGIEGTNVSPKILNEAKKICRIWKNTLENSQYDKGVFVEDKVYTLCIHYRMAKNRTKIKRQFEKILKTLTPKPTIIGGKFVFNLLPARALNKGDAIELLLKKTKADKIFYIGDDDTDEDVFSLNHEKVFTVRIGRKKVVPALYFIDRQSQINQVLKHIVDTK